MEDDDFLVVDCVDGIGKGTSIEEHVKIRRELIALAKASVDKNKVWRFAAHSDLFSGGDRARRDAGLDQLPFTQKEYKQFSDAVYRNGRAAFSKRRSSHTAASHEAFGEKVDVSKNASPQINESFGERISMNVKRKPKKVNPGAKPLRSVAPSPSSFNQRQISTGSINTFKRNPQ
jgi:hypothetical protein